MTEAMKNLLITVLLFISAPAFLSAQGRGRAQVAEGNRQYDGGNYEQAIEAYNKARSANPASAEVDYNLGNALYQKKDYEQALKRYETALQKSEDPRLRAQTYYNMGNTLFRMNKLKESAAAYQQALRLDPGDEDAKYNLEYVRARLQQEEQQQQDKDQQKKKIEPSEYAKKLRKQAQELIEEYRYAEALKLMQDGLKTDETVAAYQSFIDRLTDVVEIEEMQ